MSKLLSSVFYKEWTQWWSGLQKRCNRETSEIQTRVQVKYRIFDFSRYDALGIWFDTLERILIENRVLAYMNLFALLGFPDVSWSEFILFFFCFIFFFRKWHRGVSVVGCDPNVRHVCHSYLFWETSSSPRMYQPLKDHETSDFGMLSNEISVPRPYANARWSTHDSDDLSLYHRVELGNDFEPTDTSL